MSSYQEIKDSLNHGQDDGEFDADQMENLPKVRVNEEKVRKEVADIQAENKKQYKRLADAMGKSESYGKVQAALTLDKHMKGKGKKRKIEDAEGRTYYNWFA